ncbi:MAG: hemerythrin domain-containing protein [Myxococcales bacterium]|nr:hemerythrin domain-containing protein [Myxococcales bacterium]
MDALFAHLEHEHRTIVDVMDAFARYLDLAKGDVAKAPAADLPRFLVFFREYVDLVHHEREERVLLPALTRHGFAAGTGPLAHIKEQHEHERQLLHELWRHGFRQGGCSPDDEELQRLARAFIAFQRGHVSKEAQYLYPAAKTQLKDEKGLLLAEDTRFDAEQDAYGRRAWLERLVGELVTIYGASPEPAAPTAKS